MCGILPEVNKRLCLESSSPHGNTEGGRVQLESGKAVSLRGAETHSFQSNHSVSIGLGKGVPCHPCRAPLLEECPQHHGHKGDPEVTPGTCGAIGERAQVILVWVRAPGRWERLPPTETTSHEGKALSIAWLVAL